MQVLIRKNGKHYHMDNCVITKPENNHPNTKYFYIELKRAVNMQYIACSCWYISR